MNWDYTGEMMCRNYNWVWSFFFFFWAVEGSVPKSHLCLYGLQIAFSYVKLSPYKKPERQKSVVHFTETWRFCRCQVARGTGAAVASPGLEAGPLAVMLALSIAVCDRLFHSGTFPKTCEHICLTYSNSIFLLKSVNLPVAASHYTVDRFPH